MYGKLAEEIWGPQVLLEKELWLHTTESLRQVAMCVLYRPSKHQTGKSHENHNCIGYPLSPFPLMPSPVMQVLSID